MKIKFFDNDELISPEEARNKILGLIEPEMQALLVGAIDETVLNFGLSTIEIPFRIDQNNPDANPDPKAEANAANYKLARKGSGLRIIVEE